MSIRKLAHLSAVCIASIATAGLAQQTGTTPPATTETPPPATATTTAATPVPDAAKPSLQEEVVVTGSRIRRKDLTTPAPVTVVSRQQIETSGRLTIGDYLQTMPEQGNAPNFQLNTGGINYGADATTRINLRSLGVQRTLVLINGRRVVPAGLGASPSVDLNTIPAEAVDRVEVLKDGASAIYGSDAIAGVVNVITRRNYNGTDLGAQYGVSAQNDASTIDAHITSGHSEESWSALFSVRYMRQGDSWLRDRSWSQQALDYDYTGGGASFSGSSRTPQGTLRIPEDPNNTGSPLCNGNALCNAMVKDGWKPGKRWIRDPTGPYCGHLDGTNQKGPIECFRIFNTPAAANDNTGVDFYNFAAENYLTIPSQTVQAFANGDVKFTGVRGYYEASYTQRTANQNAAPMPLNPGDYADIVYSKNSIYNPFGSDLSFLGRRLVEFGHRTYSEDTGTFRVVTGLDGTLQPAFGPLQGWYWDTFLNYGRTQGTFTTGGSFRNSRVKDAVGPSMLDATNKPVCVGKPGDLSTIIPGCVPLNLVGGPGSITPDETNYLAFTGTSRAFDEMITAGLNLGGDLFTLMAERPASLAIGYEFRRQLGSQIADPIVEAGDSADFNFKSTSGSFYANEVYAELSLPLISGIRGAELLEADAAVRYVNYNTFGGNTSYKLGARWTPLLDITVRGTYSTAFRAPSISELYLGGSETDPAATDPCQDLSTVSAATKAQCLATGVKGSGSGDTGLQELTRVGGNSTLQAETAKAWTAGIVFQPQALRGFTITVDYYDIAIENAIGTYGTPYILEGCYTGLDPKFCSLVVRNESGAIQYVNDFYTNTGKKSTAGVDFAVRYATPSPYGRFAIGWEGNWLNYFDSQVTGFPTVHGKGNFDLGAMPAFKSNVALDWSMGGAVAGAIWRYVGNFHECSNAADPTTAQGGLCNFVDGTTNPNQRQVGSWWSVDLHLGYSLPSTLGTTSLFFGVNNVFDKAPPYIYSAPLANSDPLTYDFLGRYVYGRIAHKF